MDERSFTKCYENFFFKKKVLRYFVFVLFAFSLQSTVLKAENITPKFANGTSGHFLQNQQIQDKLGGHHFLFVPGWFLEFGELFFRLDTFSEHVNFLRKKKLYAASIAPTKTTNHIYDNALIIRDQVLALGRPTVLIGYSAGGLSSLYGLILGKQCQEKTGFFFEKFKKDLPDSCEEIEKWSRFYDLVDVLLTMCSPLVYCGAIDTYKTVKNMLAIFDFEFANSYMRFLTSNENNAMTALSLISNHHDFNHHEIVNKGKISVIHLTRRILSCGGGTSNQKLIAAESLFKSRYYHGMKSSVSVKIVQNILRFIPHRLKNIEGCHDLLIDESYQFSPYGDVIHAIGSHYHGVVDSDEAIAELMNGLLYCLYDLNLSSAKHLDQPCADENSIEKTSLDVWHIVGSAAAKLAHQIHGFFSWFTVL